MSQNFYHFFTSRITDPNRPLFIKPDGSVVTYGAIIELSGKMANALAALGVKPDDRVVAYVDKSVGAVALYLGCLRMGAVYIPLNTAFTLKELEFFIADAEPRAVICSTEKPDIAAALRNKLGESFGETLGTDCRSGSFAERVAESSSSFTAVERRGGDIAAILYTSGTTGRPKGAMLTHENLAVNALALKDAWQMSSSDIIIHALPIFHIHGLFVAVNVSLLAGSQMIFLPKFSASEVLSYLPRATVLMGVPTFYVMMLKDKQLNADLVQHMRLFISGSAPLLASTHTLWRERTKMEIVERYGMTETGILTSNPVLGERVPGTVGIPLPGVKVRITDRITHRTLPRKKNAKIGMIEVKGPNVFAGYWQMLEKTKEAFRRGKFFITGDLGFIDERGYLNIAGREKDVIITGGENVYPKEVEQEIDAIDGVMESAVVGVPHEKFGEGVTAIIVRKENVALSEQDVFDVLRKNIAGYKLPKKIIFTESLPRNAMGKVQKEELRRQYCVAC